MNNDLISRSALIKRMREVISHTPLVFQIDVQSACETIEALVDVAPAVDAEPVRHGEWNLLPADIWDAYECSVCKKVEDHPSRFCPNCGAQMYIEDEKSPCLHNASDAGRGCLGQAEQGDRGIL